jgi:trimeric autotransporter adhesin
LQVGSSMRDTTLTITPSTTTLVAGSTITFTATIGVTSNPGYALSGIVSWSDNGAGGTFSPSTCIVSDNSCSLVYTPPTSLNNITITASYGGDELDLGSSATAVVLADGSPSVATSGTMNVQTDMSSYSPGENVTITSYPAGAQVGQNVAIVVTDPSLNIIASRAVQVGTQGDAVLQIGLPPDALAGSYQVTSTALVDGNSLKGTTQFTVSSQAAQSTGVSIVSIQPTDQEGSNVVTSFERGTTGYAKIVLSSASSQSALVTINLTGPDGTSLGVGSIKTSLGAGDSEMVVSFYVPTDANVGTGSLYADMFTDWPSNGGTPLTPESSGNVGIA